MPSDRLGDTSSFITSLVHERDAHPRARRVEVRAVLLHVCAYMTPHRRRSCPHTTNPLGALPALRSAAYRPRRGFLVTEEGNIQRPGTRHPAGDGGSGLRRSHPPERRRRRPRAFDEGRLSIAWPRWHRDAQKAQRFRACAAVLEGGPDPDVDGHARCKAVASSPLPSRRQISPHPDRTCQNSLTVASTVARFTSGGECRCEGDNPIQRLRVQHRPPRFRGRGSYCSPPAAGGPPGCSVCY